MQVQGDCEVTVEYTTLRCNHFWCSPFCCGPFWRCLFRCWSIS